MLMRVLLVGALLCAAHVPLFAAPDCPAPAYAARTSDQIGDWHEKYIRTSLVAAGAAASSTPAKEQIEALVDQLTAFHRRSISDPLYFEVLARQIMVQYANTAGFRGLDTGSAAKLFSSGGNTMDFSMLCIDTRTLKSADDTFAITLFGVTNDACRHASLRGLVFTGTLINGSESGECRPDHNYFKRLIIPVLAGTNTVTFVCNKDIHGCARR